MKEPARPAAHHRRFASPILRRIVEHVFLVDGGGIPMVHLSRQGASDKDPDLIASMFTAVQSFMNESFRSMGSGAVRSIELADYHVVFGRSAHALLFVLYRGRESNRLERRVEAGVRELEERYGQVLREWAGEVSRTASVEQHLQAEWRLRPADAPPQPSESSGTVAMSTIPRSRT